MRILATIFFLIIISITIGHSQQVTQIVRGIVVDKESKTPINGAVVVAFSDSVLIKGTTSDEDGKFKLDEIPVGRRKLIIKFIGYNEVVIPVTLTSGKELVITIEL